MNEYPTAFISYSWEDDEHKNWVKSLASRLRDNGVDVKLDQWEIVPGDQLPNFMEKSIREIDYVLIICTPKYKSKSDKREGGVGYEGDIITGEVFQNQNQLKFIPILRKGNWKESAPTWISGKYYIDLSELANIESNFKDLITTILNIRETAPPLGQYKPTKTIQQPTKIPEPETDEIRIKGILVDEVGEPLNDGSPGSALYKIPFELNKRPDYQWSELFRLTWDRPPSCTSMHRPGIGYVSGNKIILDGTTIEEVKKYHKDTLKLVVETVNKRYKEIKLQEKLKREREEQARKKHNDNIRNIADDIQF
ncbi:toll/interleukin-1 receptor domain-containing protein [Maribellus sediminis]|uniref:toll/interleukin-1 receptor domain-containing protein n=1 Tax=Maribellus sediminis TaxID=2696285 RepID=UPI00142FDD3B|nr:toll/interleukin-1 receptor domain-containing protein [Maribellus sediminis]